VERPRQAGTPAHGRPQAKHDVKFAQSDAQDAEDYAAFAVDFACSAIEEAEYA
jgi:hypothetical protein